MILFQYFNEIKLELFKEKKQVIIFFTLMKTKNFGRFLVLENKKQYPQKIPVLINTNNIFRLSILVAKNHRI